MHHTVLAIGTAAVTASGCVWYLPAIADLQAGDDRPRSARTAAAACVLWWAALAMAGGLLLVVPGWEPAARLALAGLVAGVILRIRAHRQRRAELREDGLRWAMLDAGPAPRVPRPGRGPGARTLLGWLLVGLAVSSLGAVSILLSGGGPLAPRLATAAGSAAVVCAAFLLIGVGDVRRHHS
ncbi:hypothetical protein [Streptomyces sp. CB01881]|uniref:hypothetical protein n=1 Tax=Streptomyces sp. CB01881 TaxID=2078691 RepID=UPI000CDC155D|nr:hypothetical protein [Streptomyces sp. CB01881]AUY53189.1 hypothetical protein C2142_34560 [Streptomyces sp. CB01881]TYC69347.1 hypothetical protein EH183_34635 [Streptomyces sp. CB01881]